MARKMPIKNAAILKKSKRPWSPAMTTSQHWKNVWKKPWNKRMLWTRNTRDFSDREKRSQTAFLLWIKKSTAWIHSVKSWKKPSIIRTPICGKNMNWPSVGQKNSAIRNMIIWMRCEGQHPVSRMRSVAWEMLMSMRSRNIRKYQNDTIF